LGVRFQPLHPRLLHQWMQVSVRVVFSKWNIFHLKLHPFITKSLLCHAFLPQSHNLLSEILLRIELQFVWERQSLPMRPQCHVCTQGKSTCKCNWLLPLFIIELRKQPAFDRNNTDFCQLCTCKLTINRLQATQRDGLAGGKKSKISCYSLHSQVSQAPCNLQLRSTALVSFKTR